MPSAPSQINHVDFNVLQLKCFARFHLKFNKGGSTKSSWADSARLSSAQIGWWARLGCQQVTEKKELSRAPPVEGVTSLNRFIFPSNISVPVYSFFQRLVPLNEYLLVYWLHDSYRKIYMSNLFHIQYVINSCLLAGLQWINFELIFKPFARR